MKSKILALSKNEEFRKLIKRKKISNKYVTIFFGHLNNKNEKKLNISFVTKKKIGNAVKRNKIKRRLKNIMNDACKKISSSFKLPLSLEIIDGNGQILQSEEITLYLNKKSANDEDDPPYWHFKKRLFFYNPTLRSLRFRLSIQERIDCIEQEWIDFDLRDRIVSIRPLSIRRIG